MGGRGEGSAGHHHRFVAGCLDSGHTDRSKSDWTLVTYRLTRWDIDRSDDKEGQFLFLDSFHFTSNSNISDK